MTDHPLHYVSEYDILDRIAARFGLDFTVNERTETVDEKDEHGSRSSRDATGAELQMWRLLVQEETRRACNNVWPDGRGGELIKALPATPEEVYSNCLHHERTYLCAEDAVRLMGLPSFEPQNGRELLLDGMMGTVQGKWKVYLSRQIPQGYFHAAEGQVDILQPVRVKGERQVVPPVDPQEFMRRNIHFEPLVQRWMSERELEEMRTDRSRKATG
jgi:hypothetical protein